MILSVNLNPCIDKTVLAPSSRMGSFVRAGGVEASDIRMIAGGKGNNVARVLRTFGYDVHALNLVGGIEGKVVLQLLDEEGITYTPVYIKGRTREIITIVETESYQQTAHFGPSPEVTHEERRKLMDTYKALVMRSELVIMAGSLPDASLDDIYCEMIRVAKALDIKTILDTRDEALKRGIEAVPFAVKPNVTEAEKLLGMEINDETEMHGALDQLSALGIPLAILSMGDQGALVRYEGETYVASPPQVDVINPVGSGDSFVAGLAIGLVDGMDIESIIRLGVAAGAANASIWDAASITKGQVEELLPLVEVRRV